MSGGRLQEVTLLHCRSCQKYLTTDGYEIPSKSIMSREGISKSNMRTITAQLNSKTFQDLEELLTEETGSIKIMNEIVALGLKRYRETLS